MTHATRRSRTAYAYEAYRVKLSVDGTAIASIGFTTLNGHSRRAFGFARIFYTLQL